MVQPDSWPWVAAFIYLAFAATIVKLAFMAGRETGPDATPLPRWYDAAYIGASALFILLTRLPILELSRDLQPDEAQYGANAILAHSGWLNWDTLDSGSSGPMQAMAQAWPMLLGMDVTFTTIHLTGALLACVMSACVYLALRRTFGTLYGVVFALPVTLFFGAITYWDLVHSTSLYFPLTLAMFGVFALATVWRSPNLPLALVAAFGLGLIPLAKLHGVILAGYVGLPLLYACVRRETTWKGRILTGLIVAGAAAVPVTLSVVPLLISGKLGDLILETVGYSAAYVSKEPSMRYWFLTALSIPHLFALLSLFALSAVGFGAFWVRRWRQTAVETWYCLGMTIIAFLSLIAPGRGFHHYLVVFVPTLALPAAALASEALRHAPPGLWQHRWRMPVAAAIVLLFMAPTALWSAATNPALRARGAMIATGLRLRSPHLLNFLVTASDARPDAGLVVFGYMPSFYVDAEMQSGTRETWAENVIVPRPNLDLYRRRYVAEMEQRRPAVFIDAVAKDSFLYINPDTQGLSAFPALSALIARDYVKVSATSKAAGCPDTYLRREDAARLDEHEAPVAAVTASGFVSDTTGTYTPDKVIDRDVFETCVDRWIAPAGQPAWIDLALKNPTQVARVELLNTRGLFQRQTLEDWGHYTTLFANVAEYRAARSATVQLMNGDTVIAEQHVKMDSYPYWTPFAFKTDSPLKVTHVRIMIPDWRGAGAGLNEVSIIPEVAPAS